MRRELQKAIRRFARTIAKRASHRSGPNPLAIVKQADFSEYRDTDWELFRKALDSCQRFGEYGAGLSTGFVSQNYPCQVRSIESDREWAKAVRRIAPRAEVIHIDLGPVGKRGRPKSLNRAGLFHTYFDAVFEGGFSPDVILVDGRFRVACFLTALLKSPEGTIIVFDDYPWRPNYHVVEELIKPHSGTARQTLFLRPATIDQERTKELIRQFSLVMD